MSKNSMTVYDVIGAATDEGEWVNGEFHAVVRNATPRQGKKPSKADLCDPDSPNIKIKGVHFGVDLTDYEGAVCLFHGKGIKVKSYQGNAEVTLGDKSLINVVTAAPAGTPKPAGGAAPGNSPANPPKVAAKLTPAESAARFHKGLKKISLLWLHCEQYASDVFRRLPESSTIRTEAGYQSLVSSLFITAKDNGLLENPPAPRELDAAGVPKPFVPPAPPADEQARKEREDKAAKEAAEKARREHEEAEARRKAELDEDVPF